MLPESHWVVEKILNTYFAMKNIFIWQWKTLATEFGASRGSVCWVNQKD
ncbi:hypothetical protein HNR48_003309 [Pseudoteredinibacter isoporae]|uniref:Uncharacterized protein n=1 Tax=Pseudoteredinibacter isoporae TaxID=570281 RepID=A0A7X0MZD0_9GAMM|nr:hypothetical protein [Pseudoteredinibacter isoporae]